MVTVVTVVFLSSDDYYKQSAIFLLGLYHLHVYIQVSFSLFFPSHFAGVWFRGSLDRG